MFAPEQFEDAFHDMIDKSLKKYNTMNSIKEYVTGNSYEKNIDKLVIVIDNIDRCDRKTAYELLTNIKNFIKKTEGIIFLVPVDDEALKRHIQGHNNENEKEAEEFLRKFFNVTLKIKHFQPRDLFEFTKKLNITHDLGLNPDTLNIIAKEYASNPRRIIQTLNNLSTELKILELKHGTEFIDKHQNIITKLLIIREEWSDIFKTITKAPHSIFSSILDDNQANKPFSAFMERTRAITANFQTIEKIVLNITNDSTLPVNIITMIENNKFDELQKQLVDDQEMLDNAIHYAIEKLRVGTERKTYSTDSRNALVLISVLNSLHKLDKAYLNELIGFFNDDFDIDQTIRHLDDSGDNLESFFNFVNQNTENGFPYLQEYLIKRIKEIWGNKPKDEDKTEQERKIAVYTPDTFINHISDLETIKILQKEFIAFYYHISDTLPLHQEKWIYEERLRYIISKDFINVLVSEIETPVIKLDSLAYQEIKYLAEQDLLDISDIEEILKKAKSNFSQFKTKTNNIEEGKKEVLEIIFNNIEAIRVLMENIKKQDVKSQGFIQFIQEILNQIQFLTQNGATATLNLLADISPYKDYQQSLLSFFISVRRMTTGGTNVIQNITALVDKYPELKEMLYQDLIKLRDEENLASLSFFDWLINQNNENKYLLNLYKKLFSSNLDATQKEKVKNKLIVLINKLAIKDNETLKTFIVSLMQNEQIKNILSEIIISKSVEEILKLPPEIKKLAYHHICDTEIIFGIENEIETIKNIASSGKEYHACIHKILKRKFPKTSELQEALEIIESMGEIESNIKKGILSELKNIKTADLDNEELKSKLETYIATLT